MPKPKPAARPVLRLVDCETQRRELNQQHTLSLLRALLVRAAKGELLDLMACYTGPDGERFVTSGRYEKHAEAVYALERVKLQLVQKQNDLE